MRNGFFDPHPPKKRVVLSVCALLFALVGREETVASEPPASIYRADLPVAEQRTPAPAEALSLFEDFIPAIGNSDWGGGG